MSEDVFYSQDIMFHGQEPAPELQPDGSSECPSYPLILCILVLQGFKTHFNNRGDAQEFLVSTLWGAASVAARGHKEVQYLWCKNRKLRVRETKANIKTLM